MIKKAAVKLKADESSTANIPAPAFGGKDSPKKGGMFDTKKATNELPEKKSSFSQGMDNKKDDKLAMFRQPDTAKTGLFSNADKSGVDTQPTEAGKNSMFSGFGTQVEKKKPQSPVSKMPADKTIGLSMFNNDDKK